MNLLFNIPLTHKNTIEKIPRILPDWLPEETVLYTCFKSFNCNNNLCLDVWSKLPFKFTVIVNYDGTKISRNFIKKCKLPLTINFSKQSDGSYIGTITDEINNTNQFIEII